jgi:hypothetical protein
MSRCLRRRLLAASLACPALASGAQAASAAVVVRAGVSPATVSSPATVVYSLTMVNDGDVEERFSVALIAPTYRPGRPGEGIVESNAVRALGDPSIEGPGSILGGFTRVAGLLAACSATGAGGHGYGIDGTSFDVGLPPRSTSTLRAAYEAGLPFWRDLDLRMRFAIRSRLTTGKQGTLAHDRRILSPQPAITGPVAVHMTFATTPATGLMSFAGRRPIARGKAISIVGRTVPAIARERVELRYARIAGSKVVQRGIAARVRVGSDGTFRGRWTPPRPGSYELWARYSSTRPSLVSDDTCPRLLRVRRS